MTIAKYWSMKQDERKIFDQKIESYYSNLEKVYKADQEYKQKLKRGKAGFRCEKYDENGDG